MSNGAEPFAAVVLSGGAGTRVGGRDKGLIAWRGTPLVELAVRRLAESGASEILISANRHLDVYLQHGHAVVTDEEPSAFRGPLAGIARALTLSRHDRLLTVPVDVPTWPIELPRRLSRALAASDRACAVARVAARREPLFALYRTREAAVAARYAVAHGELAVHGFQDRLGCVEVDVEADPGAFANLNSAETLA